MRSPLSADRIAVELQSRLGPYLADKDYLLTSHGPTGVSWRRGLSARLVAGAVLLGLLGIATVADGGLGGVLFGSACVVGAVVLAYVRRPASVVVTLAPVDGGGTEVSLSAGPDTADAAGIVRATARIG
jgi:hypothetical protein